MKSKKGAFANSSTGYGKRQNSNSHKTASKSTKSAETSSNKKPKQAEKKLEEKPKLDDQENDLNSGFGNYLRSNEGIEMMKIFVFANTVMVIVTMAWPHFKAQCYWLFEWWDSLTLETI